MSEGVSVTKGGRHIYSVEDAQSFNLLMAWRMDVSREEEAVLRRLRRDNALVASGLPVVLEPDGSILVGLAHNERVEREVVEAMHTRGLITVSGGFARLGPHGPKALDACGPEERLASYAHVNQTWRSL